MKSPNSNQTAKHLKRNSLQALSRPGGKVAHYVLLNEASTMMPRVVQVLRPRKIPLDAIGYTGVGMPPLPGGESSIAFSGFPAEDYDYDRIPRQPLHEVVQDWRGAYLLKAMSESDDLSNKEFRYIRFFVLAAGSPIPEKPPTASQLGDKSNSKGELPGENDTYIRTTDRLDFAAYREAVIAYEAGKVSRSKAAVVFLGIVSAGCVGVSAYFLSQLIIAHQGGVSSVAGPGFLFGCALTLGALFIGLLSYKVCDYKAKKATYTHLKTLFEPGKKSEKEEVEDSSIEGASFE